MRFFLFQKGGVLAILAALVLVSGIGVAILTTEHANSKDDPLDWRDRTEIQVVLAEDGFHPSEVRIKNGTTVTFSTTRDGQFWPASNSHPSHELYPAFDPLRPIEPGETWSFVVTQLGTWGYHDHIRAYFRGTLYVE